MDAKRGCSAGQIYRAALKVLFSTTRLVKCSNICALFSTRPGGGPRPRTSPGRVRPSSLLIYCVRHKADFPSLAIAQRRQNPAAKGMPARRSLVRARCEQFARSGDSEGVSRRLRVTACHNGSQRRAVRHGPCGTFGGW